MTSTLLQLDEDQKLFVDVVKETILQDPRHRRPIFLTGGPGSGKTMVFEHVVKALRDATVAQYIRESQGKMTPAIAEKLAMQIFPVVTPTSSAASRLESLGAVNLQRLIGTLGTKDPIDARKISKSARNAITLMQAMFYDEVSMWHPILFRNFDLLCREVRNCPNLFMGGVALIAAGDFFQLKPTINDDELKYFPDGVATMLFDMKEWKRANFLPIVLGGQHRQANDKQFAAMLNRARTGSLTEDDVLVLCNRVTTRQQLVDELASRLTTYNDTHYRHHRQQIDSNLSDLCFANADVDDSNATGFNSLPKSESSHTYTAEMIFTTGEYKLTEAISRAAEMSSVFKKDIVDVNGAIKQWTGFRPSIPPPENMTFWTDTKSSHLYKNYKVLANVMRSAGASSSSEAVVKLKRGCKVMCTMNDPSNLRIFNSLKGTVIAFMTPTEFSHASCRYVRAYSVGSKKRSSGGSPSSASLASSSVRTVTSFGDPVELDTRDEIAMDNTIEELADEEMRLAPADEEQVDDVDDYSNTSFGLADYIKSHSEDDVLYGDDESVILNQPTEEALKIVSALEFANHKWPVVSFVNGEVALMTPQLSELQVPDAESNGTHVFVRSVKLKLAYAFSVHKQQGATLTTGYIVPSINWSMDGIMYVALSRFKDLSSFAIRHFKREMIQVDDSVRSWYEKIEYSYKQFKIHRQEAEMLLQMELDDAAT